MNSLPVYDWIEARVSFTSVGGAIAKTFRVEKCSFNYGCDLLERMIESYELTKNCQAVRIRTKASRGKNEKRH